MNSKFLILISLIVAVPFTFLYAADVLPANSKNAENVVVSGDEVLHNLYVGGGLVVINKEILGDLFVVGGTLNIAAPVEKDLVAAGGNINVVQAIGEDVRLAGGNIAINSSVGGDLLAGGGTITLTDKVLVGGDLWAGGGTVNIGGVVNGEGKIGGRRVFINGTISGPLEVWADNLTFDKQAKVAGPIKYHGRSEAVVQDGAQIGTIEFFKKEVRQPKATRGFVFVGLGIFFFIKLIAIFLAGLLFLKLFRSKLTDVLISTRIKFWENLGIGIVALIVAPILALLLCFTLFGGFIGGLLFLLFAFVFVFSAIVAMMFVGVLVEELFEPSKNKKKLTLSWKTIVWGVIVGGIVALIPVIGWLVLFVLYVVAFGAMVRHLRKMIEM